MGSYEKEIQQHLPLLPLAFGVLLVTGCGLGNGDDPRVAAIEVAEPWLALLDDGKYQECWEQCAPLFRDLISHEHWLAALKNSREPLGPLVSRKLVTMNYRTSAPDGSRGKFYILQYKSSFEKRKSMREYVTIMLREDLEWQAAVYQNE